LSRSILCGRRALFIGQAQLAALHERYEHHERFNAIDQRFDRTSTKTSDTSGQNGADLPPTQGMQQVPRCPNDSQQEHRNHNGDNDCEDWITA